MERMVQNAHLYRALKNVVRIPKPGLFTYAFIDIIIKPVIIDILSLEIRLFC